MTDNPQTKPASQLGQGRYLFHSFPRPRTGETEEQHFGRALRILKYMADIGLVLAPEVVRWDVDALSGGKENLEILQRRICFTELSVAELPEHCKWFGPIALACNIQKLRNAGALPVIYAPQAVAQSAASQLGTFAVRGTYHTRAVLNQFENLRKASDPVQMAAQTGLPVAPNYTLNLQNTGPGGTVVAGAAVPAAHVQQVMSHVGFNNIPFNHSIAVLSIFLDMFYPTDNVFTDDELGYYRQREWRLVGANLAVEGHDIARVLTPDEQQLLRTVDEEFWTKELTIDGKSQSRSDLALLYRPTPSWTFTSAVESIFVPAAIESEAKSIFGDKVTVLD